MDETTPLLVQVCEPQYPPHGLDDFVDPRIEFDPNGDPENPQDWSESSKKVVIALLSAMAFMVTFTCISIVPIANHIVFSLNGTENRSSSILLVTVWELGEALGPLIIAPLSEIYGRYPVYNIANLLFIFGIILAALSQSVELFVFARFLTGMAVACNVLNPSIVGDIYPTHRRSGGMSLAMFVPLIGGAVGPAMSGVIAERVGWRVILWMSAAVAIMCEVMFFLFYRETYRVTILQQRAARLRSETYKESLKVTFEDDAAASALFRSKLWESIQRPARMMYDSSVMKIMALYGGVIFTWYYILATTLPDILTDVYGFSPALTGYSFLLFSGGAAVGLGLANRYQDRIYLLLAHRNKGRALPEFKLPPIILAGVCLPPTIVLYGLVPANHFSVYLQLCITVLQGCFLLMTSVSLMAYVVDATGNYSASATTIVLTARCLAGTLLPLGVPYLTNGLGLGWGYIVIAGIGVVIVPLPMLVFRYGPVWRRKSIFTTLD